MAEGGEDKEQKTEQPTQRRLEEAVKKGQIPFSREVSSFMILFVLALTIAVWAPGMMRRARDLFLPLLANAQDWPVDRAGVGTIMQQMTFGALMIVALPWLAVITVAIGAALLQNGVIISTEPIKPKLEKISLKKGIARMFSMRSIVEFLKGIFKIGVVATVAYLALSPELNTLKQLVDDSALALLLFISKLAVKLVVWVTAVMFLIALVDLIYQRFDYIKNLRMSKQEMKDEYKQQEGDPHIKGKLKQLRMERAKNRMMAAVPDADVVITNPTHFAVALKYEQGTMEAPMIVAKGQDFLALTMRKIAEEHDVPIVENPPLARALFTVDVDETVPMEHYAAVAEVISYVWRLKGKKFPKR